MRNTVVFDLGGVLIDWDPRHLYRKLFNGNESAMEHFLTTVCTAEWNKQQDAGRACADAARFLKRQHEHHAELIDAYYERFDEMMSGPIEGTVEILKELHARGTPLFALSNFSAETYPLAAKRFEFLRLFRDIVVSGDVKVIKPDPAIYKILLARAGIEPTAAVFVDDVRANVEAAGELGILGVHFTGPEALRVELRQLGLV